MPSDFQDRSLLAAIELGGTKTVVAVGTRVGEVVDEVRFATDGPAETLGRAVEWLRDHPGFRSLGVGSFGPIRVDPRAPDWGTMLATPKPGWAGFGVGRFLRDALGVPVALDTDVNAAVLAEARRGAAKGLENVVYLTIGTGIGGGVLSGGRLVHGALHPEFGHLKTPRAPGDSFEGVCPFHRDCLEGMASGPAIAARWGVPGSELPADHAAWDMQAWYLAHGLLAALAILSPGRAVIGGGVSQVEGLHAKVNRLLQEIAAGYFPMVENGAPFVVPPDLGQQAGISGALMLAAEV